MQVNLTRLIITLVVLVVIIGGGAIFVKIYPDLLWFDMVGYLAIYKKVLLTKIGLGLVVGGFFLAVTLTNLYLLYRFTPARLSPTLVESIPLEGMPDFNLRKACLYSTDALGDWREYRGRLCLNRLLGTISPLFKTPVISPSNPATSLDAPANRDATDVLISELEYSAKGLKVGDAITIKEGDSSHSAKIRSISPGRG